MHWVALHARWHNIPGGTPFHATCHVKWLNRDQQSGKNWRRGVYYAKCVKNNLNFTVIDDAWLSTPDVELLSIILKPQNQKSIIVIAYYRPPSGQVSLFFDHLVNVLNDNCEGHSNLENLLTGDTNVDTCQDTSQKALFDDFIKMYDLEQVIQVPTRISRNKSSVLDHILVRGNHFNHYGLVDMNLSDHLMVFVVRKKDIPKLAKTFVRGRSYRYFESRYITGVIAQHKGTMLYHVLNWHGVICLRSSKQ